MGRGKADFGFWREAQALLRTDMTYAEVADELERRTGRRPARSTLRFYAARMKNEDEDAAEPVHPAVPNRRHSRRGS